MPNKSCLDLVLAKNEAKMVAEPIAASHSDDKAIDYRYYYPEVINTPFSMCGAWDSFAWHSHSQDRMAANFWKTIVFLGLAKHENKSVCHSIQPPSQNWLNKAVKSNRTTSTGGEGSYTSTLYRAKETSGLFEAKYLYITITRSIHLIKNTHWTGFYMSKWKINALEMVSKRCYVLSQEL